MMKGCRLFFLLSMITIIGSVSTEHFQNCSRDSGLTCRLSCRSINVPSNRSEESAAVLSALCVDNSKRNVIFPYDYQLTGCPKTYSSTTQSTDGVCLNTNERNQPDLYLKVAQMATGLHTFNCLVNDTTFVPSYAIVVNSTTPYRDILIFVDDKLQNNMNVNITAGDNLTVVAREVARASAVGHVTSIIINVTSLGRVINATNRLGCSTGLLCKDFSDDDLQGRYQNCTFNSTAMPNEAVITFYIEHTINATKVGSINITVNVNPSANATIIPSTSMPTLLPSNKASESDNTATLIMAIVIPLLIIILLSIIIVAVLLYRRRQQYQHSVSNHQRVTDHESANGSESKGGLSQRGGYSATDNIKVMSYTCEHVKINQLLNKLRENGFCVEELEDIPPLLLPQYLSKLESELNQGTVLVDCSCPGGVHSTLYKAVKNYTQKPVVSLESQNWKMLKLSHSKKEIRLPAWSTLYDHLEVMKYNDINDDVVDKVVKKLEEYSPSRRTSSINSDKPDLQQLVIKHEQNQQTMNKLEDGFNRIEKNQREIKKQIATGQKDAQEQGDAINEKLEEFNERQVGIMKDIRQSKRESEEN